MVPNLTPSPRAGMPFGGEVLVPGAPFQKENGYLGMWLSLIHI